MRFRFYSDDLAGRDDVLIVDGHAPVGKHLSHWPGNRTPGRFKADTSTEMALRLAAASDRAEWLAGVEVVTNNHLDTDGLLATWAVLHPEAALERSATLVAAAQAGDFEIYTTPEGVRFDLLVEAFADPDRSPLRDRMTGLSGEQCDAVATEALLDLLPGLFDQLDQYETLWREEFERIGDGLYALNLGMAQREEYPGLTLILAQRPLHWTAAFTAADNDRVLMMGKGAGGRWFDLRYKPFTWFDTVSRPVQPRVDLGPLADELNRLGADAPGRWFATPLDSTDTRLYLGTDAGELSPCDAPARIVLALILRHLDPAAGGPRMGPFARG